MVMTVTFDEPYLDTGTPPPSPPSSPWPISIDGVNFVAETSFEPYRRDAFRHRSIPSQRESINLTNEAGEGTVNTEGLWRRGMDDWSLGAGQYFLDRRASVPNRFYRSKGLNPWTQWQLTLLNATAQQSSGTVTGTFIKAIAVAGYVYILSTNSLSFTQDWSSFTTVSFLDLGGAPPPTLDCADICTDGQNIWVTAAGPPEGIYTTTVGASTCTQYVGGFFVNGFQTAPDSIAYVNGRLMVAAGPALFNITHGYQTVTLTSPLVDGTAYTSLEVDPIPQPIQNGDIIFLDDEGIFQASSSAAVGDTTISVDSVTVVGNYNVGTPVYAGSWAAPDDPLFTMPNASWRWTCYAGGSSQIYIGGSVGPLGPGAVYRTTLNSDGITLAVPVVALPMEGGEVPTALFGYLNFIFVGSTFGLRMCQTLAAYDPTGNEGDLRAGPLIPNIVQPVSAPVTGITGSGRFVYFAWNNYDDESTGLGRCDLSTFIDELAPAYASDLMVSGQGLISFLDWDPITQSPLISIPPSYLDVEATVTGIFTMDPGVLCESGSVESGLVTFGIPDDKIAMLLEVRQFQPSNLSFSVSLDGGNTASLGEVSGTSSKAVVPLNQLRAETFDITATLTPTDNMSPELLRWTLKALPAIVSGIEISAVIKASDKVDVNGQEFDQSPYGMYAFFESLRQSQKVVPYVEGPFTADVTVDSIDFLPNKRRDATTDGGYESYIVVYLKTLSG